MTKLQSLDKDPARHVFWPAANLTESPNRRGVLGAGNNASGRSRVGTMPSFNSPHLQSTGESNYSYNLKVDCILPQVVNGSTRHPSIVEQEDFDVVANFLETWVKGYWSSLEWYSCFMLTSRWGNSIQSWALASTQWTRNERSRNYWEARSQMLLLLLLNQLEYIFFVVNLPLIRWRKDCQTSKSRWNSLSSQWLRKEKVLRTERRKRKKERNQN